MAIWRKFLMFFISLVLSLSLTIFIVGVSIDKLLYLPIYKEAFEQNGVYDLIEQNIIPQELQGQIELPEGTIEGQVDQLLENFFAYLRYDSDVLDLTIRLKKETLEAIVEQKIREMPKCEIGQEPLVGEQIVCIPQGINTTELIDQVLESQNIPMDEVLAIDLTESILDEEALGAIEQVRDMVQIHKDIYLISIIVSLIFVFLSIVINLRDLRAGFRWLSYNILFTSISAFAIYATANSIASQFINFDQEVVNDTISYIFDSVMSTFKYSSFVLLIAGVFLFGLSFLFKKKDKMTIKKFHTLDVLDSHREHVDRERKDLEEKSNKEVVEHKRHKDVSESFHQRDLNKTARDKQDGKHTLQ